MTMPQVLIWDSKVVPDACVLDTLVGVEDMWELLDGIPRASTFPTDANYTMHPDFPYNTLLTDNLINRDLLIVVSARLKAFLEARVLEKVEYLPVTIMNHKNRPASRDYFIVHPVYPLDCLQLEHCEPKWSEIDTEAIERLKRLVIDESKLDPKRALFRPKSFYRVTLVRHELADAIDGAGFTGISWKDPARYH